MLSQEILQLSRIPESNFHALTKQALNQALWQFVLYFEDTNDMETHIPCLLKESLSKLFFRFFCIQNKLPIEFNSTNNERFLSFQFNEQNWEQVHLSLNDNPIQCAQDTDLLPALLPSHKLNCDQKDEYGNKLIKWTTSMDKQVVFTYLNNNSASECFTELVLPRGLERLYQTYFKRKKRGKNLSEIDFWKKLKSFGEPTFSIRHHPDFYITAWAGNEHWKFFYNSKSDDYPKIKSISETNKTIKVHRLPAFSQLFPQFNESLHFAKFLS